MIKKIIISVVLTTLMASTAIAGGHCAADKTLTEGKLTIATGNPAYFPWVIDDAPESGQGFEAAVAYAVAKEMGFSVSDVVWVRSSFDEAIQPGVKNFDFNMQQYSITPERDETVDFSAPYFTAPMAVLVGPGAVDTAATMAALKGLKWGASGSHTSVQKLMNDIRPTSDPLLYADNAALFLSAVMIEGSKVIGQFAADESQGGDQFGMLLEDGNPLKICIDDALAAMTANGTLAAIEATWLQDTTGVPLIQ